MIKREKNIILAERYLIGKKDKKQEERYTVQNKLKERENIKKQKILIKIKQKEIDYKKKEKI